MDNIAALYIFDCHVRTAISRKATASRYQAEIEELEAEFKNIMMKVSAIEKAFSYANPWLIKFQDLTLPEVLELAHIRKYVERVWIEDFKRVEVVLKEEEWTRFFPEEWLRTRKEN